MASFLIQRPPEAPDEMFVHELALELHMPVGEMFERMSAHELLIDWPCFFAARRRQQEREQRLAEQKEKTRTLGGGS